MTKKLWIFGDSFSYDHAQTNSTNVTKQWHRLIASELDMDVMNISLCGAGMDWIYYQVDQEYVNIKEGDVIVITPTLLNRRWLIQDRPECSGVLTMDIEANDHSNKVKKAFYQYFAFLDHRTQLHALFLNWLYSLDSKARDLNCRILLIPCFNDVAQLLEIESNRFSRLSMAQGGYLYDTSDREHVPKFRKKFARHDGRYNHLTLPNHQVLADKIVAWYKDGITVDLSQGFYENLIDGSDWGPSDLLMEKHILVDF